MSRTVASFGAPETEPAGNSRAITSPTWLRQSVARRPTISELTCRMGPADVSSRSMYRKRRTCTPSATIERSLRIRSTIVLCSAVSLGSDRMRSRASGSRASMVPFIGFDAMVPSASIRTKRSGEKQTKAPG